MKKLMATVLLALIGLSITADSDSANTPVYVMPNGQAMYGTPYYVFIPPSPDARQPLSDQRRQQDSSKIFSDYRPQATASEDTHEEANRQLMIFSNAL